MKIVNKIALSLFCLAVALVLPMRQVYAVEDTDQEADSFYITLESSDTGFSSSSGKAYTCYRSAKSGALDASYSYYYVQSDIYDINQTYYFYLYKVNSDGVISDASYSSFLYDKSRYVYEDGGEAEQERTFSSMHLQFSPSASFSLNVPVFLSREALENYIESGDDSGWINKPEPEEFSYFSLSGFQYDDSIFASWSGILTDLQLIKDHIGEVEVVVSPSFFLILEPGEEYQEFKEPEKLIIPLGEDFRRSYDSFFEGNPYKGRALLTLNFYPRYYDSATGCMYRGDSISVRFDAKGKITDVDFPESSFTPVYDPGCYFDSPASTTVIDPIGIQKTFFRWNKVRTSYVYRMNYIAVDLGYDGKWYSYSVNDFFSSNSISVTWKQVENLLKDYIDDGFPVVTHGYKIRYTPYYKTDSGLYYGKPIIVSVAGNAITDSITELNGDYLDETIIPDFVDKKPSDWFEDTSLWDNVEQVTDHIKDDMESTVDLDNLSFNFFKMLKAVINACGQLPALVSQVFSFLPADISKLLVLSLSLIIILRILGR